MKDLKEIGFKCGVEIHQQLLTDKKLFCHCFAGLYSKEHHAEVLRHMRPTLSEMGVYDGCALMEFKTKKEIYYLLNKNSVCTYEMDDTPPFHINSEAIDITIEIALLLNCQIVDELHIARKQYLDGSIPTGFQRTAIIGVNGWTFVDGKKIYIRQISLEEDACREVKDEGHNIYYRTDRLGMPLIEVVTEPDMVSPKEAARVVKYIGRIMRSTGKVRRGIGAVRQDVNVSVTGGTRVEIKGVPRYQLIPELTKTEAYRQKALLDLAAELKNRKISKNIINEKTVDVTEDFRSTKDIQISNALKNDSNVMAIPFRGFAGIFNLQTQPGRTFGHEISGRVRVIACPDQMPNIYTTDNYPTYIGSHIDEQKIKKKLNLSSEDTAIIVWGPNKDTKTAVEEIKARVLEAFDGVPNETREAMRYGLTDFERILPGADRMYPDTDHPPVRITKDRVSKIKSGLPKQLHEVEKYFIDYGFSKIDAEILALSPLIEVARMLIEKKIKHQIISRLLIYASKNLTRHGFDVLKINNGTWIDLSLRLQNKELEFKNLISELKKKAE